MRVGRSIIFGLCFIAGWSPNSGASECDHPRPEWIFTSCWQGETGASQIAVREEPLHWSEARTLANLSVVTDPPPGGPPGNALRVLWPKPDPAVYCCTKPGCKDNGQNNFVRLFFNRACDPPKICPALPNPMYIRVYFWSDQVWSLKGRKFFQMLCENQTAGATGLYINAVGSSGKKDALMIKNGAYSNGRSNCGICDHLEPDGSWRSQESNGVITPRTWHSVEFGWYKHPTSGWLKAWLDGKMVINATPEAFGGAFNTVNASHPDSAGYGLQLLWDPHKASPPYPIYEVQIDGTGKPNTFRWTANNQARPVAWHTGVPITGKWQTLDDDVSIRFSGTRGGKVGDSYKMGCNGMIDILSMPSFANGCFPGMEGDTHTEYFMNVIISSAYIGPIR